MTPNDTSPLYKETVMGNFIVEPSNTAVNFCFFCSNLLGNKSIFRF